MIRAGAPPSRRQRIARLAGLAALLALALDLTRPPARQWSARAELALIRLYRETLARPLGGLGVACRFEPTCSRYAEATIAADGALLGTARAGWRIVRCGPWTRPGSSDPP